MRHVYKRIALFALLLPLAGCIVGPGWGYRHGDDGGYGHGHGDDGGYGYEHHEQPPHGDWH